MGELVRRLVQLAIGQPRFPGGDGGGAGLPGRLPGEQLMGERGTGGVGRPGRVALPRRISADAGWSAADAALIRASDELHKDQFISDATWKALSEHFTEKQRMDVVFTTGQYTQVSMMLNSFGVQLDPGQTLDPDLKGF